MIDEIKKMLQENKTEEAIRLLNEQIEAKPSSAEYYFLLGNAWRKKSDFRNALNNYLKAMALDPDSPAKEAYKMTIDILNFYNPQNP